ncbi:MAG: biopolymer transporter ExbD [Phycisphaerales bacterium]|nr:biopolymer transporter ExbD [Phycisphaerales bacterium]
MVGPDDAAEASFDLTPMIDVIFLLIIFFMLSSQFASTEARPVDLPRESGMETALEGAESKLLIDIDRDGAYSVMGEPVTLESLSRMAAPRPGPSGSMARSAVVVRADRSCPASALNRLADSLAGSGVEHWSIAVMPEGR